MRSRMIPATVITLCLVAAACAASKQHKGIRNARMAVAAAGVALEATDTTVAEVYADKPPEDTEAYCRNKIAALILTQMQTTLKNAAEAIYLWEKSLLIYEQEKDKGKSPFVDAKWSGVVSSEDAWKQIAKQVIAVLDGVMQTFKLWDVGLPSEVNYAWDLLLAITGKPSTSFEFTWTDLQGSVCIEYTPGR